MLYQSPNHKFVIMDQLIIIGFKNQKFECRNRSRRLKTVACLINKIELI